MLAANQIDDIISMFYSTSIERTNKINTNSNDTNAHEVHFIHDGNKNHKNVQLFFLRHVYQ